MWLAESIGYIIWIILWILIILWLVIAYFSPVIIYILKNRKKLNYVNLFIICLINFLTGWTLIGWIISLILAFKFSKND